MKKIILTLFVLVLMSTLVTAFSIDVNCPSVVEPGDVFTCTLEADEVPQPTFGFQGSIEADGFVEQIPFMLTQKTPFPQKKIGQTMAFTLSEADLLSTVDYVTVLPIDTVIGTVKLKAGTVTGAKTISIGDLVGESGGIVFGSTDTTSATVLIQSADAPPPGPVVCGKTPEGLNRQDEVLCAEGFTCWNNECISLAAAVAAASAATQGLDALLNTCLTKPAGYAFLPDGTSQYLCLGGSNSAVCNTENVGLVKAVGNVDFLCNQKLSGFKWIECNAAQSTMNTNTDVAGNKVVWNEKNLCASYQGGERWMICGNALPNSDGVTGVGSWAGFNCLNGAWTEATGGTGGTPGDDLPPGEDVDVTNPPYVDPVFSSCDGSVGQIISAITTELNALDAGAGKLAKLGAIAKAVRSCF